MALCPETIMNRTSLFAFTLAASTALATFAGIGAGACRHVVAEEKDGEIQLGCGVDCDGGGIAVVMSKGDKSAIVELERVRMWDRKKPDEDNSHDLEAGADDKIFRVDRADLNECAELVTDRKELAALRKQRLAELRHE
jgi:hypothetical protein